MKFWFIDKHLQICKMSGFVFMHHLQKLEPSSHEKEMADPYELNKQLICFAKFSSLYLDDKREKKFSFRNIYLCLFVHLFIYLFNN